jgi:predicted lipoprotein with Yx(FWY)xxD motif
MRAHRVHRLVGLMLVAGLVLAACGDKKNDDNASDTPKTTAPTTEAPTTTTAPVADPVKTADSSVGKILVDAKGMTLYAFTNDTAGMPTCKDACATAWPATG